MVDFVERHQSTIQKFRVTTTESCLARIKPFLGKNVVAAHSVETAVMGGEAQVATQVVLHDVGAAFVFRDPIVADAAQVDSDALLRLLNVHNISQLPPGSNASWASTPRKRKHPCPCSRTRCVMRRALSFWQ